MSRSITPSAPTGKWEKVTDEVLAVFDALQKEGHKLKDMGIFGDSAGGGLAAGSVLKMRDKGLGMPGAIVLWSPWADITNSGDSAVTLEERRADLSVREAPQAGGMVKLDLYDAMPHVFQQRFADASEGKEAMRKMTTFLKANLGD